MTHPLVTPPTGPPVHQARLLVSAELIHQMLKMPTETRILAVTFDGRTFDFRVEDPRLFGVEKGQELPQIQPLYTSYMPTTGMLIQAAWPFEDSTEITGDTFPDDEDPDLDGPGNAATSERGL